MSTDSTPFVSFRYKQKEEVERFLALEAEKNSIEGEIPLSPRSIQSLCKDYLDFWLRNRQKEEQIAKENAERKRKEQEEHRIKPTILRPYNIALL